MYSNTWWMVQEKAIYPHNNLSVGEAKFYSGWQICRSFFKNREIVFFSIGGHPHRRRERERLSYLPGVHDGADAHSERHGRNLTHIAAKEAGVGLDSVDCQRFDPRPGNEGGTWFVKGYMAVWTNPCMHACRATIPPQLFKKRNK